MVLRESESLLEFERREWFVANSIKDLTQEWVALSVRIAKLRRAQARG
jgi:hypothetical protein